ncbi:tetratricopeptide repeat protein [Rubripirellula reticaptiva]|uniref:Tetratricopeptide repeat protein n=1 Tax=Rubripirellula reticaptiva TaxID=2528013 RepID=A0A5C6EJ81_9BACT|nr:tetratricopeptide repeat protein [Rubripirellula reticaptiva]TWU47711.1 Tetratricopeptide repeat protein [Rubripirellula reticaptiva]
MNQIRLLLLTVLAVGFPCGLPTGFADVTAYIDGVGDLSEQAASPDAQLGKLLGQAKSLIESGNVAGAHDLLATLETNPDVSDVDVVIADLMFSLGRVAEGQQWLERASAKKPQSLAVYLAFSELAVRQRRWFDGWVLTRLAERLDPPAHWSATLKDSVATRLTLLNAVCCEGRTEWKQARKGYEDLVNLSEKIGEGIVRDANLGLARSCFRLQDYDAALAALTTITSEDNSIGTPNQLLAQFYEQSDMLSEADAAYAKSIAEAKPDQQPSAHLAYARFLLHTNAPEMAKRHLQFTLPESPNTKEQESELQFLQAVLARMEGDVTDAQTRLSKLHQTRPSAVAVSSHLASILVDRQDEAMRARALQIAESAVRNSPNSADAWATLGWVRLRLGDYEAADKSLMQSLKLGKPSRDTLHYLAEINRAAGKTQEAETLDRLYETAKGPKFFATRK